MINPRILNIAAFVFSLLLLSSCHQKQGRINEKILVEKPEEINAKAEDIIKETLADLISPDTTQKASITIRNAVLLKQLYAKRAYQPSWSAQGRFYAFTDSMLKLIDSARYQGLFPQDYYQESLAVLRKELNDTSKKVQLDAAKWAYSDLLLSDAFVQFTKDLTRGRLIPDSILIKDSLFTPEAINGYWKYFTKAPTKAFTDSMEIKEPEYQNIKAGLAQFLAKADLKKHSYIRARDSLKFKILVYKRISEEDSLDIKALTTPDSASISQAIRKYQKMKKLRVDGKLTPDLISQLNNSDLEKFIRIAITLDKIKMVAPLPIQYIWVNIPSYYLQVHDSDSVVLTSRVVIGKPETKTPVLRSMITDMVTYPKWTIPESIVQKDVLPGLQRDPGYTRRKGFMLVDKDGNEIDPYSIKWASYKKNIPYKVIQGSGDDNALGVLKFNFPNDHSVYLHDTNQRYLFGKAKRALSHGCVRVQAWDSLARFILTNDSLFSAKALPKDSLSAWLERKEKHYIPVRRKIPVYIRYQTCGVKENRLVFYEDIYGEDRRIREKIFSDK